MEREYDYVIVGAGSSGATLAARLTEDAGTSVLCWRRGRISARPTRRRRCAARTRPGSSRWNSSTRTSGPTLVRSIRTSKSRACTGAGAGPAGARRSTGRSPSAGCSKIMTNGPSRGAAGWSGEECLPYFNKLENDLDFGDAPYHGRSGPIPIYRAPLESWGPVDKALREAALDLGYGWNPDHNAPVRHRRLALHDQQPRQPPRLGQRRLPGAGPRAAQPDDPGRRARRAGALRRHARGRRAGAHRGGRRRFPRARDRALGRVDLHPADPAALRESARPRRAGARHRPAAR